MKIIARSFLLTMAGLSAACGADAPGAEISETQPPLDSATPVAETAQTHAAFRPERESLGEPVSARSVAERLETHRFDWKHHCTVREHQPDAGGPISTKALLPGDAVDGTTVEDTDFDGVKRSMRHFNGKYVALRLQQSLLDQAGLPRVRRFIEEMDFLYHIKVELIGLEPQGTGRLPIVAIPAADLPCGPNGYACSHLNSRRIQMVTGALTADDGLTALNHELNHAFDRLSAHLFTNADFAHSWTEVLDTMTFHYLRRDENPHPFAQGMSITDNLRYRRFDRLVQYEQFPGASWNSCINLQSCDPLGDAKAQDLSVHAQAGVALRVFELFGTNPGLKRWLSEAQSLATARGYVWDGRPFADRRDFLIETLSRGVQANLSCLFDAWNWQPSAALRTTLNSLYGTTNPYCSDADGDGFTRHRYDCNDSNNAVRPNASETANGVDDDCNGIVDDIVVQESGDFPSDQASALTVPVPVHIKGSTTEFDRDSFRVNVPTTRTVRLYVRSLGPKSITDIFDQGGISTWKDLHTGSWGWSWYKITLNPGVWDFRIFGWSEGPYEIFLQPDDLSFPVEMPDGWPITYTPAVASNPSANQYVIPAPPIPSALAGTPGLQVRHFISNFSIVGTVAATSSFTWTAPAGTNAKALQYRSEFVTSSSGPPVWPLSQFQSLVAAPSWTSSNVGTVSTAGALTRWFDNFWIEGAGTGITGTADSFRYGYVKVSGNADIVARVVSLENTNANALAGVVIRENLNANARNVVAAVTPSDSVRFQRRTSTGGSTATTNVTLAAAAPRWVRLQRSGSTFRAFRSSNGTSWTQIGTDTSISMAATVHVGVGVTSANASNAATAQVDAVQLTGSIVP